MFDVQPGELTAEKIVAVKFILADVDDIQHEAAPIRRPLEIQRYSQQIVRKLHPSSVLEIVQRKIGRILDKQQRTFCALLTDYRSQRDQQGQQHRQHACRDDADQQDESERCI